MGDGRDGRGVTGDLCFLDGIGVEILNMDLPILLFSELHYKLCV